MIAEGEMSDGVIEATVKYTISSGYEASVEEQNVRIHSSLVIDEAYPEPAIPEGGTINRCKFRDALHESLVSLMVEGSRKFPSNFRIDSYNPHSGSVRAVGEVSGTFSSTNLLAESSIGSLLALEGCRGRLIRLGLVESYQPVLGSLSTIERPIHLFMKKGPFRDVTQVREGTVLEVTGYHQGCAVVEADGEEFWLPIEESIPLLAEHRQFFEFDQDLDNDGVPDSLEVLPSHVALGIGNVGPRDNWNAQTELRKVASRIHPTYKLKADEDFTVLSTLEESYVGTLAYHADEREGSPETHDDGDAPGSATDMEHEIEKEEDKRDLIGQVSDKGDDGVSPNDDGTPEDETGQDQIARAVEAVLDGASLDCLLS